MTTHHAFSQRTSWDRRPNALADRIASLRQAGRTLIDLTESNPTRAGLEAPLDLLARLAEPAGLRYEPDPRGLASARSALALALGRRGPVVAPENLLLTASSSEAYGLLFKLLCDPGDTVLAPRPSYPLFAYLADLESVRLAHYPLRYDGRWEIDLPALAAALTPRTRAVVVVNPNNPTGSFVEDAEREELVRLCREHGSALIVDEVFAEFPLCDDERLVPTFGAEARVLTFCLGGLSKSLGLPQLKLGWIAASGPAPALHEALERLEIAADTYLTVSTPVQRALPALLERAAELQAPIRERVTANLARLHSALSGSTASPLRAEGGWTAVVRVPATRSDEQWALELLETEGLVVHPGHFFDFDGPPHLVLSLLVPVAEFEAGLAALRRGLESAAHESGRVE